MRWVGYLLAAAVEEMREAKLSWYVGLYSDGTRIGDALWNVEALTKRHRAASSGYSS